MWLDKWTLIKRRTPLIFDVCDNDTFRANRCDCLLNRYAIVDLFLIFVGVTYWQMRQCVAAKAICDKQQHCRDSSDEEMCAHYSDLLNKERPRDRFPPAVIHMDGQGDYNIQPLTSFSLCPRTHFLCRGQSLCVHTPTSCVQVSLSLFTHTLLVSRSVSLCVQTLTFRSVSLCPHTHFLCPGQSL